MPQANTNPVQYVPRARAGTITDATLERLEDAAKQAAQGTTLDHDTAALLLLCAPSAFYELRQRRAAMETIGDMTDLDNVLFLRGDTHGHD